jgi:hypothetical protein
VKAAQRVRAGVPTLRFTYDRALSILFLDRLGDPADRETIRSLAARLLAGQRESGGWSYWCPILSAKDEKNLLTALAGQQSRTGLQGSPADARNAMSGTTTSPSSGGGLKNTTQNQEPNLKPVSGSMAPLSPSKPTSGPFAGRPPTPREIRNAREALSARLKQLPALHDLANKPRVMKDGTDNSNTQFAILGIWVASRHGVPVEHALAAIAYRFRNSQKPDGGWLYGRTDASSPAMTGAGLLGLAVGLGLAHPEGSPPPQPGSAPRNSAVERGLRHLAESIGKPVDDISASAAEALPGVNAYFLWTLERVGVLYNLRYIDGKDWYRWGAQVTLQRQRDDGSWHKGAYPGCSPPVDSCLTLLFLNRSNLVQDLTKRLEFVIDTKTLSPAN